MTFCLQRVTANITVKIGETVARLAVEGAGLAVLITVTTPNMQHLRCDQLCKQPKLVSDLFYNFPFIIADRPLPRLVIN
jgi:hypothetical protein